MKIRHYIIVGFLALVAAIGETHGQAVVTLSSDTIVLGDQVTLSIQHARNYPGTEMLSRDGIVALSQSFDTVTHTQSTVLTSFEPGQHFVHLGSDDSLSLTVLDVEVDTSSTEIRDITPIEKIPYTFWEIFRWVLLVLALAALILAAWWIVKHRKQVSEVFSPSAPVDHRNPEERALDRLNALRQQHLWQNGKVKEYHTELTDSVRTFIEESTGIRATEMTSDETIAEVEHGKWNVQKDLLRGIFNTADLVKFAKSEPLPHEHDRSMNDAVTFIKELWQQVSPKDNTTDVTGKEATNE